MLYAGQPPVRRHLRTVSRWTPQPWPERIAAYAGRKSSAPPRWSAKSRPDTDLSRMMQELPAVEDLLENRRRAHHPHAQRPAHAGRARRRQRHPHRALRAPPACASAWTARCARWCNPTALHAALISRLKIMAELDISEKRLPRDGASMRCGIGAIDVRVSTCPAPMASAPCCACGQVRKPTEPGGGGHAGRHAEAALNRLIAQPHGIILVTAHRLGQEPPRCTPP